MNLLAFNWDSDVDFSRYIFYVITKHGNYRSVVLILHDVFNLLKIYYEKDFAADIKNIDR